MFLEELIAMYPRTKTKSYIDDSTWERLIEKLSVIDFDLAVRSIKTESGELGEPVFVPLSHSILLQQQLYKICQTYL